MAGKHSVKEVREQAAETLRVLLDALVDEHGPEALAEVSSKVLASAEHSDSTYVIYQVEGVSGDVSSLTSREREIVERVAQGKQNQEIAAELSIARATVAAHLRRIFTKCRVNTRTELARKFLLLV